MGYKVRNSRGFLGISNATLSYISTKPMEYAFKVDRKSKREKDVAVLSAIMIENGVNATA